MLGFTFFTAIYAVIRRLSFWIVNLLLLMTSVSLKLFIHQLLITPVRGACQVKTRIEKNSDQSFIQKIDLLIAEQYLNTDPQKPVAILSTVEVNDSNVHL